MSNRKPAWRLGRRLARAARLLLTGDVAPLADRVAKTLYKLDPRVRHAAVDFAAWPSFERLLEQDRAIQARYAELWSERDIWNIANAPSHLGQQILLPGARNPFALFEPNLAVLDFVQRENLDREAVIVDYCSGYGHLVVLLRTLGYRNVYGFDDFSQVNRDNVRRFLGSFGMEDAILDTESLYQLGEISLLACVGYFFSQTQNADIIRRARVRRLAFDPGYSPIWIPGYRLATYYHGLLMVHARQG